MYEGCVGSEIGDFIFLFLMVTSLVGFLQLWRYGSQAPESRLPYATRPPPLPDPQPSTRIFRCSGLIAFVLSLATYLEVDENDALSYVGSGFGHCFDYLIMILAVYSLVGSIRLLRMEQAPDIRRTHSVRPPPKPDPVTSATSRRRAHKQALAMLRAFETEQRLKRRVNGLRMAQQAEWSRDCWWRAQLLYFLPAAWFLGQATIDSSLSFQLLGTVGIGWLLQRWLYAVGDGVLRVLDAFCFTQSGQVISSTSILESLLGDADAVFGVFRSIGMSLGYELGLFGVKLGWFSWLQTLQWNMSWNHLEALYFTLTVGDLMAILVRQSTSCYNLMVVGLGMCCSSVWDEAPSWSAGSIWDEAQTWPAVWFIGFFWLLVCPPLPTLLRFLTNDTLSAWRASQFASLDRDLESLLCGQDEEDWTDESSIAQSLTTPPPPLPRTRRCKPARSRFGRLFRLVCFGTLLPWASAHTEGIDYVAASAAPDLTYGENVGSFKASPMGWRYRRRLRHISSKACKLGSHFPPSFPAPVASPSNLPTASQQTDAHIASWVRSIHPALEGRKWLAAEYMDKVVMQRLPSADMERVSVNLAAEHSAPSAYIQAIESVFNSLSRGVTAPLIVDSGASCCISPHREDFVTYGESDIKIKDLSGLNKVAGEGMLLWKVSDKFGREYEIQIKGYHIPHAKVRLLSPQCIIQAFPGSYGGQTSRHYVLRLQDGTILEAPYGMGNLPVLRLSNKDVPSCFHLKKKKYTLYLVTQ